MTHDKQLRFDLQSRLGTDPSLDATGVLVAVKDGVVTLGGHVPSYADKWTAERLTKNVMGVHAIANDIEVRPVVLFTDSEIATAALALLHASAEVPAAAIKVIVRGGWISLEGHVQFWHQSQTAERTVRGLWGVKGVINAIEIRPQVDATDVSDEIRAAFQRHADLEAAEVHVAINGGTVTLSGTVNSWREREDAEAAAWSAPGVARVKNDLALAV